MINASSSAHRPIFQPIMNISEWPADDHSPVLGNGRLPLGLLANPACLFAQIVRGSQSGDRLDEYTRIHPILPRVQTLSFSPSIALGTPPRDMPIRVRNEAFPVSPLIHGC